jgi:hypothetical protein
VKVEITAQAVKEAYEKTGFIPTQKVWYNVIPEDGTICACGMTALAVATDMKCFFDNRTNPTGVSLLTNVAEILGLAEDEVWAFADGFDGRDMMYRTRKLRDFNKVGQDARALIFGEEC